MCPARRARWAWIVPTCTSGFGPWDWREKGSLITARSGRRYDRHMKTIALFIAALGCAALLPAAEKGWIEMFNGKTLEGWKTNERPESWTAKDGAIVGDG